MSATEIRTHPVVITQRYAEKEIGDGSGAKINVVVTTSQVASEMGIDQQLHLEVSQPDDVRGRSELITVRKNLSWEDAVRLNEAAEALVSVAETWRSTPSSSRNSLEFSTAVIDGLAIGRRTCAGATEYFVSATDDGHTTRCEVGGLDALVEFITHVREAANRLR
jgi:hypothetical protein